MHFQELHGQHHIGGVADVWRVAILRKADRLDKGANKRFDRERHMKRKHCLYNLVTDSLRPVHVTLQHGKEPSLQHQIWSENYDYSDQLSKIREQIS